ncbi:conserved hypothetical protein [Neospora caninum Liverpool]|uniref:CBF1-interacting co-repressor CIR N-terminal domain-containing protein n=1 Tax=Neospora caninum (strain Liverpool) TaxID=572307 RepID=F0V900_NEOCL|nr:conserved hypothetical protein [Neospora caninum Liverpool]CBZ50191.1 conserved hypothetical protein [Neospora caninum Liverpool]CEL64793.1 TPA: hypothetical protein BN1204_006660 [Neospora caninum Liverpool]|eukprot:XP_003880226.1 conserved hypothetical protein [Neospora caninum Liverpool]
MGGHGGLNILPQKRWHLYRHDNRLRVQRDEERERERQTQRRHAHEQRSMLDILTLLKRRKLEAAESAKARDSGEEEGAPTCGKREETQISRDRFTAQALEAETATATVSRDGLSTSARLAFSETRQTLCPPPHASSSPSRFLPGSIESGEKAVGRFLSVGVVSAVRRRGDTPPRVAFADSAPFFDGDFFPDGSPGEDCSRDGPASDLSAGLEVGAFSQKPAEIVRVCAPASSSFSSAASSSSSISNGGFRSAAADGSVVPTSARLYTAGRNAVSVLLDPAQNAGDRGGEASVARHVNLFSAEEKEMHKLEEQRRKYLQQAGYTPDSRSEFDSVIREALHAKPWYHCPPSSVSKPAKAPESLSANLSDHDALIQSRREQARAIAAGVVESVSRRLQAAGLPGADSAHACSEKERASDAEGPRGGCEVEESRALKEKKRLKLERKRAKEKARERRRQKEKKAKRKAREAREKKGVPVCVVISDEEASVLSISSTSEEDEQRRRGDTEEDDVCVCLGTPADSSADESDEALLFVESSDDVKADEMHGDRRGETRSPEPEAGRAEQRPEKDARQG